MGSVSPHRFVSRWLLRAMSPIRVHLADPRPEFMALAILRLPSGRKAITRRSLAPARAKGRSAAMRSDLKCANVQHSAIGRKLRRWRKASASTWFINDFCHGCHRTARANRALFNARLRAFIADTISNHPRELNIIFIYRLFKTIGRSFSNLRGAARFLAIGKSLALLPSCMRQTPPVLRILEERLTDSSAGSISLGMH